MRTTVRVLTSSISAASATETHVGTGRSASCSLSALRIRSRASVSVSITSPSTLLAVRPVQRAVDVAHGLEVLLVQAPQIPRDLFDLDRRHADTHALDDLAVVVLAQDE